MRIRARLAAAVVGLAALFAGCNGGSTSTPVVNTGPVTPTPSPTPTPAPPATSASGSLTTSATTSTAVTLGPVGPGNTGTVTVGASNPATTLSVVLSLTLPANAPTPVAIHRLPQNIGVAYTTISYFQITANPGTVVPSWPGFSFTFAPSQTLPDPTKSYVAVEDSGNAAAGYNTIEGPASASGNTYTWTAPAFPVTLVAGRIYTFVLFTAASTLATPTPAPTPTPTPTATPIPGPIGVSTNSLAFTTAGASVQFTVTENSYNGPLTATSSGASSCSGIATFSPASGNGPAQAFTVTSVAAGTCTIVVADNHGGSVGVAVTVTTTSGTINAKTRQP
jgi:hypothetical protein